MKKTVVELFAGVGGFRCGLNNVRLVDGKVIEDNNWEFVWANQWEPSTKIQHAFDCYTKRFGDSSNHSNIDISQVDKKEIPDHTLLVGGFPCQDYSVARSLSSEKGIEGVKGVLWWQIADIIKEKNPPFVLLENVDRLLRSPSKQRGRDFAIMLRTFAENGYGVEWRVINASEYGFVQRRRRVFIFAFHNTTNHYRQMILNSKENITLYSGLFAQTFPVQSDVPESCIHDISRNNFNDLVEVSDKFDGMFYNTGVMLDYEVLTSKTIPVKTEPTNLRTVIQKNEVDSKYFINNDKLEKWEYLKGSKKIERVKPNGETYHYSEGKMDFPDSLDKPARTMLTSESSVNRSSHALKDIKTGNIRTLTPIEAERINGFPDDWTNTGMPERRRYFMMGNALVVELIEKLNTTLKEIVSNE